MSAEQTVTRRAPGTSAARAPAPANATQRPPKLITDITVQHGPVDLLGRFFLKADTAARQRDVHLSFAPMQELIEVNRSNRDTWRPLLPLFDPASGGITPENSFCILGRNSRGEVVATQAARLYQWADTDFHEEAESLRLWYETPERSKRPGEKVEVTAPDARKLTGQVMFAGGIWYRSDYRGLKLPQIIPRISRAYAYTRWRHAYSASIIVEAVQSRTGMAEKSGYSHVDWAVTLTGSVCGPSEIIRCALVWMDTDELLGGIERFLTSFNAQVDVGVDQRRAQQ